MAGSFFLFFFFLLFGSGPLSDGSVKYGFVLRRGLGEGEAVVVELTNGSCKLVCPLNGLRCAGGGGYEGEGGIGCGYAGLAVVR